MKKCVLEEKLNNYENIVRSIIETFNNIDFHIIVETTIHKKILKFDPKNKFDKDLINDLKLIINDFAKSYSTKPITFDIYKELVKPPKPKSFRNNEIGIFADKLISSKFEELKHKLKIIEKFERLNLNGYPDEVIFDKQGRTTYLEVKTTSRRETGSPRDFFFSPLTNSKKKITDDARHLLLCFDIDEIEEKHFLITGWCLIDLFDVKVTMKPEFNTNNLELYKQKHIIYEQTFN